MSNVNLIELTESEYKAVLESRKELSGYYDDLYELYAEAFNEGVVTITEAKFSFLPKFKQSKELSQFEGIAKEADNILNSNGTPAKTGVESALNLVLKILRVFNGIDSVLSFISCITIVGIIPHLVFRAVGWAIDCGAEAVAKSKGQKIISELQKAIDSTNDEKLKKQLEATKEKVANSLNKIN